MRAGAGPGGDDEVGHAVSGHVAGSDADAAAESRVEGEKIVGQDAGFSAAEAGEDLDARRGAGVGAGDEHGVAVGDLEALDHEREPAAHLGFLGDHDLAIRLESRALKGVEVVSIVQLCLAGAVEGGVEGSVGEQTPDRAVAGGPRQAQCPADGDDLAIGLEGHVADLVVFAGTGVERRPPAGAEGRIERAVGVEADNRGDADGVVVEPPADEDLVIGCDEDAADLVGFAEAVVGDFAAGAEGGVEDAVGREALHAPVVLGAA